MRVFSLAAVILLLSLGLGAAQEAVTPFQQLMHRVAEQPKNLSQKGRVKMVCTSLGDVCTSYSECCAGEGTGCGWVAGCPVGKKCCY